jgi:hypothetical protein
MRPDSLRLLATCALLGSTAICANAHDSASLRGRLVVADHEVAVVRILDLDTGSVTHQFAVPRPNPAFKTTEDGRFVVVTTRDDAGSVRILDTGMVAESHGDHVDFTKAEPRMLDIAFTGERPAHVTSRNGQIAIFYDGPRPWDRKGDAKVDIVDLKSLSTDQPQIDRWQSPGPQHGIALSLGKKQWLMSMPNPAYVKGDDKTASSRPNGFAIFDRSATWNVRMSLNDVGRPANSCKLFHGQASIKDVHVFACNEGADGGLLVVSKASSGRWTSRKLSYPGDGRSSALKSADSGRYMVGNYGLKAPYTALIRVAPDAKALTMGDVMTVPGAQPVCLFEVDAAGKHVANLTPDGRLRIYDIAQTFKEVANFDAVPAFDCAFDAKAPKPSLAVVGNSLFVSDPAGKRIREFYLNTLKQGLDYAIDGIPTSLATRGH